MPECPCSVNRDLDGIGEDPGRPRHDATEENGRKLPCLAVPFPPAIRDPAPRARGRNDQLRGSGSARVSSSPFPCRRAPALD